MDILNDIESRMTEQDKPNQELVLVRGASGSGKSTFVGKEYPNHVHLETDMYWYDDKGDYNFDPTKLKTAHEWCQRETLNALKDGKNVVVSNTFIKKWEIEPYINMAKELGIPYKIYRMTAQYDNVHGVPLKVVKRMRDTIEPIDGETIVK